MNNSSDKLREKAAITWTKNLFPSGTSGAFCHQGGNTYSQKLKKKLHFFSLEGKLTENCNPTRFRAHIYKTIVGHCIPAMLEWDETTKRFKTCRVSFYFYFCLAYLNQCFNVLNRKKAKYLSC